MKNPLWLILLIIVLAVAVIVGISKLTDWQIEEREEEIKQLEAETNALESQLSELRVNHLQAVENSRQKAIELEEVRSNLHEAEKRLEASLEELRRKTAQTVTVIEEKKKLLPTMDDRELAEHSVTVLPGSVVTPLEPGLFEINREGLVQVGIFALDLETCREMNLLLVGERDTAQRKFELQIQRTDAWIEQYRTKEAECLACSQALETAALLEDNLTERLEAERARGDAWKRKYTMQKYMTIGGLAGGLAGGVVIGTLLK